MRRIFKKLDTPVSDLMDIAAASVLVIRELKVKGGPPPELPSAEAEAWALFGRDIDVARFELDQARRGVVGPGRGQVSTDGHPQHDRCAGYQDSHGSFLSWEGINFSSMAALTATHQASGCSVPRCCTMS